MSTVRSFSSSSGSSICSSAVDFLLITDSATGGMGVGGLCVNNSSLGNTKLGLKVPRGLSPALPGLVSPLITHVRLVGVQSQDPSAYQ